jgi:hypothetical protein
MADIGTVQLISDVWAAMLAQVCIAGVQHLKRSCQICICINISFDIEYK